MKSQVGMMVALQSVIEIASSARKKIIVNEN